MADEESRPVLEELDVERQLKDYKFHWPCLQLFRTTMTCLQENENDISQCQTTVAMLNRCTEAVEPITLSIRLKNLVTKSRFLSTADDYGRDENIVKRNLEKVAPSLFNEEERQPSKITEALQQNLPRIFADDDDDEEEDGTDDGTDDGDEDDKKE